MTELVARGQASHRKANNSNVMPESILNLTNDVRITCISHIKANQRQLPLAV